MNDMKSRQVVKKSVAVLLAAVSPVVAHAAAQDVASLYGPQPPANATYLRVVNLASQPARVALPGSERAGVVAPGAVTRFSVVTPGTPLRISVDGKDVADDSSATGASKAATASDSTAGAAITVALEHDVRGWHATRIAGRYERVDGLKATLRAFNFSTGCSARIAVDGNGPAVFAQVATADQQARAINPVAAKLVGSCGAATTQALALPTLTAGDSYSLFVTGDAAKPVLTGVRDALAWPPAAN
jgi:alginate O-acetyltransferase complex protein AlgF